MNETIKVGQTVVCVGEHSTGILSIGQKYRVEAILWACSHGPWFDVGLEMPLGYSGTKCRDCGKITTGDRPWIAANLFTVIPPKPQPVAKWVEDEILMKDVAFPDAMFHIFAQVPTDAKDIRIVFSRPSKEGE